MNNAARSHMDAAIRREVYGPDGSESPSGQALDLSSIVEFESYKAARGSWHCSSTLQEILTETEPRKRYGVGVLFPRDHTVATAQSGQELSGVVGLPQDDTERKDESFAIELGDESRSDGDYDFELSGANSFQPSAMGVSFQVAIEEGARIQVSVSGAVYERVPVRIDGRLNNWHVRRPFEAIGELDASLLSVRTGPARVQLRSSNLGKAEPLLEVVTRRGTSNSNDEVRIVTVVLTNGCHREGAEGLIFQAGFEVAGLEGVRFLPYPGLAKPETNDDEAASIELLFRESQTYGVGHGCAATWPHDYGVAPVILKADCLPTLELPSLTSDVWIDDESGRSSILRVSMSDLANGDSNADRQVEQVLAEYGRWIDRKELLSADLSTSLASVAAHHISKCRDALTRMQQGWKMVNEDPRANRAFRLTNEAMVVQQLRSRIELREIQIDSNQMVAYKDPHPSVERASHSGYWRPFQIAFVLSSISELVDPTHDNRELVDLVYFPTGGGKTEAYLGAAAVHIFARRLRDPSDSGTAVIMRYTLRLLTAQQFLRASSLICAMEQIRVRENDLGTKRISIGVWLGGGTTPNSRQSATVALREFQNRSGASNQFLLRRCPWCASAMGRFKVRGGQRYQVFGYERSGSDVAFRCPDNECDFSTPAGLPIHVVDEDLYDVRPDLVIGTVDKFALLAWVPDSSRLFGIESDGSRMCSPPGLIIQDELHLISGPLGSVVGLYEAVVEDLCTFESNGQKIRPKIIASTATIRQYEKQIQSIYGRERTEIFPPHGLEDGSSFFAERARDANGQLSEGRRYMGIYAPSLGSIQTTQVRVAVATLMAAGALPAEQRDPYWTNLNFFNSLRELGNTVSLLQSDIPDYLNGIVKRDGLEYSDIRFPRNQMELTSRRKTDEIPAAIEELERPANDPRCVDICLASSIVEVGVDINRLSLMTIVGQPKTTAQYIQVSGRVGRDWENRPGLVVTIYGVAKPRDRSHFEHFQSYHARLYAEVEPTSVTPFALPVLERALHGAALAHTRQHLPNLEAYPFPSEQFEAALDLLRARAIQVDPTESDAFDEVARRRKRQANAWNRTEWGRFAGSGDGRLMRMPGTSIATNDQGTSWEVPTSMRSVDAECKMRVTNRYDIDAEERHT